MGSQKTMYYKSSGKFDYKAILYFIISSIVVFPLLGYLYTYASIYSYLLIPFRMITIILKVIIPLVLGAIIGLYISIVIIMLGKVRSTLIASLFVFFGVIIVLYFHWVFHIDLSYELDANNMLNIHRGGSLDWANIKELLFSPSELFYNIKETYILQMKGEGNSIFSKVILLFWAVEIIMVLGMSYSIGVPPSKEPFSEVDDEWFDKKEFTMSFVTNKNQIINGLENNTFNAFDDLVMIYNDKKDHSEFILYESKAGENYLSIINKKIINKKGKIEVKETPVVKYIRLSNELKHNIFKT